MGREAFVREKIDEVLVVPCRDSSGKRCSTGGNLFLKKGGEVFEKGFHHEGGGGNESAISPALDHFRDPQDSLNIIS